MQIREFEKYIPEGAELIWFCADTQKCRSYPHYRLNNEEFKWCSVCHKWLLLDAFDHNSTVSDGFASPCRKCVRERYLASRDRRLSKLHNRRGYSYPIPFTPPYPYPVNTELPVEFKYSLRGREYVFPSGSRILSPVSLSMIPHVIINSAEHKFCASCKSWAPISSYYKGHCADGLSDYCSVCSCKRSSNSASRCRQVSLGHQYSYPIPRSEPHMFPIGVELPEDLPVNYCGAIYTLPQCSIVLKPRNKVTKPHILLDGIEHKHCPHCQSWLPLSKYRYSLLSGRATDGFHWCCKTCQDSLLEVYDRRSSSYLGWRTALMSRDGVSLIHTHHILPFTSRNGEYNRYRVDVQNGICLIPNYHAEITSLGSLHYVKSFFGLLSSKFGYDYSSYPLPDIEQRPLPPYTSFDIPCTLLPNYS